MSVKYLFISLFILIELFSFKLAYSQSSDPLVIPKLNESITLDGHVNESAWMAIEPLPLVTHWPTFGKKVDPEKTQIRIAYDEKYLYVSCICYADQNTVSAPTYKRNNQNMSIDDLGIILDTFNDKENALWFVVSPSGSRTDGAISNDAHSGINTFWDTIWEAEAVITDFGWTAEMRIPFSSLRYESNDGRVEMGLIAYRYSAHDVSMHIFPEISTDWGALSFAKPSQAKKIVLDDVESHTPVFFTPYLLAGGQRSAFLNHVAESYEHETDLTYEAGLDVKMGLTDNTTLDLTLNTDFAQVEADDQQINLTRFSLFFPERRQFFLERAAIFDFSFGDSDRLFYSRTIGLHAGQPVRILGGARMINRSGGWDIGLLSMQTAREQQLLSKNHSVVRIRRQLFNSQSYAGGMVTSQIDEKGNYNLNYGLDGIFNVWGNDFLNINIAQTSDSDYNRSTVTSESIRLQVDFERRSFEGFSYNFNYNYAGELYQPVMGFQLRNNFTRFGDRISWGWMPGDNSSLQRIQGSMNGVMYLSNAERNLETSEFGPSIELTWKRGDFATVEFLYISEDIPESFHLMDDVVVPAGIYRFPYADFSYHTPRGKSLRAILNVGGGSFFDGRRIAASVQPQWDPSRVINLSLFYQFNKVDFKDRDQDFISHIARFRTELTFNTRLTLSSFIQFNSADNFGILNIRFRYNPRDGNNFFIVFNESVNTHSEINTSRPFYSDNRALLFKYALTF